MSAIVSYSMRVPGIIDPTDPKNGVNQVNVEVQTIDHLGRVAETQSVKAVPDFKDIIQLISYDDAGRESRRWKPYVRNADKNFLYGGETSKLYDYYYTGTTKTPSISTNLYPYDETVFDNSPNNKVLEKGASGDFRISAGHTVRFALLKGTADVAKYTVAINASNGTRRLVRTAGALYVSSDLTINSVKDENVTDVGGTVYEYKDREGQVVLKRVFKQVGSTIETFSTYYVYDDLGNLSFVLPPLANPDNMTITPALLNNLCYQYKYDGQKRVTAKKIPGKGWEFIVYNKLNQVVMTQDSVQRKKTKQEWTITKYDGLGRPIITGIYVDPTGLSGTNYLNTMQNNVNLQGVQWENRIATGNGYTNITFPKTWSTTLSISYYDDYNFPGGNPYPYVGADASNMTRGLLTGSKINILGTGNMLWTVNYYDEEGRAIKNFKQHYKGGALLTTNYDETSSTYDFTGAVLASNRSHKVSGTEQLKFLTEYSYDHRGRKINTWNTINTGTRVLLSKIDYDELGNVYKKNLHSTNGTSFLQTIEYAYNSRGWLKSSIAPKLQIKLRYDNPVQAGGIPQYNGNISEFEYTSEYSGSRWFNYTYDNLNRLMSSIYSTNHELDETIIYDKAGNITSLKRGTVASTPIVYSYANSGVSNQLSGVTGGRVGNYTYDGNGSAITDGTRNVTLTYNQLNLPATVTGTSQSASYLYDATGIKLKSVQATTTREYIEGIHYRNSALDFVGTEEGRALRNTDGTYRYEYDLKDNLGNVRVSIDDNAGVARVIQDNEFYAFGLSRQKFLSGDKNNYLYNGKERQDVLIDEYDYGVRFYDPEIGRWNVMDPLAEMMRKYSPYNYAFNNPIRFIDPDGMAPISWESYTQSMDNEIGVNQRGGNEFYDDENEKKQKKKKETKVTTNLLNKKENGVKRSLKKDNESVSTSEKRAAGSGFAVSGGFGLFNWGLELSVGTFGNGILKPLFVTIGVPDNPLYFNASVSAQMLGGMSETSNFNISGDGYTAGGGLGDYAGSYAVDKLSKPTYRMYGFGMGAGAKYTGGLIKTRTYVTPPIVPNWPGLLLPRFPFKF